MNNETNTSTENSHFLTPEKLRSYPGLENLTDEEVKKAIYSIQNLASIFFEFHCLTDSPCIDNQQVVHLEKENDDKPISITSNSTKTHAA